MRGNEVPLYKIGEAVEYEDEFEEKVEMGDEEVEICDNCTGEHYFGWIVKRTQVPTGRKKRVIVQGADVSVPGMVFHVTRGYDKK
jgi:hypothetical protein